MASFEIKQELPQKTRQEIDRIEAIDSGLRTTKEAAFLVALAPYLTNEVIARDEERDIIEAAGETLPTGYSGFAKSATFRKTDVASGTKARYENVGDTGSASWNLLGEITTAEIGDNQITYAKMISDDAIKQRVQSEALKVSDDDTAGNNEKLWLRLSKANLSIGQLVGDITAIEEWETTGLNNVAILPEARVYQGTIALTDDDNAATTGTALYAHMVGGNKAILKSVTAGNANSSFEDGGAEAYPVLDDDNAAQGGIIVYFDEDAVSAEERFLIVSPIGGDLFIELPLGNFIRLKHDASAASNGVQVYFDDDAVDAADALVFVSPTNASGSVNTIDPAKVGDVETGVGVGYFLTPVYCDEDGVTDQLYHDLALFPYSVYVQTVDANRMIKIEYSATASSIGVPMYINEGANDDAKVEFVSPTNNLVNVSLSATARPCEIVAV